ncbi:MAG: hypothetical protein J7J85_00215 [Deltaproteobacteria bacterium]|nr:hypothetical protein [Deltaproteobacteria bacterium]
MNRRLRVASILLYIISGVAILYGFVYMFTPRIMPYHERFLGVTQDKLDPKVIFLILTLLKGAGAASIAMGVGIAMLVKGPFSKGDNWVRWTIFIMLILALVPVMIITLNIGMYTPWWLICVMITMVLIAMIISRPEAENR